jgi:hypothetical protein
MTEYSSFSRHNIKKIGITLAGLTLCATSILAFCQPENGVEKGAREGIKLASTGATRASMVVVAIPSPVPSYMDRGTTMVPLRPITEFLGIELSTPDGKIVLTRVDIANGTTRIITINAGGHNGMIQEGERSRNIGLIKPAETRLGNIFVPLRFITEALDVPTSFRVPDNAVVFRSSDKFGILTPTLPPEYKGRSAAIVTLTNHIGRAMSLRLSGPQNVSLELGQGQRLTRRFVPGVYSYQAAVANLSPRSGTRLLHAGRRISWTWGRQGK